jgi:hypothetical protein
MKLFLKTLLLLSLSLLASCHDSEGQDAPFLETKMVDASLDRLRVFSIFQNKAAIQEAKNLQQAVSAFLDNVDLDHLQKLRSIWQSSHNKYLANQYGFFEPTETRRDLVFAVESWPIQPGFIDSLPHYPASGIVNDITLVMDLPTLRQQHGVTDREEVCLGYHAIEYLIFERNIEDFSTEGDQGETAHQGGIERRRLLLQLLSDELLHNLSQSAELMNRQFSRQEDVTSQDKIYQFLHSTAKALPGIQRESSLLFDLNTSHGHYSQTSLNSLTIELTTLEAFFLGDVDLMPILMSIDLISAANFEKTLLDAVALLKKPEAGEVEFAKLTLMISALGHQLDNFELILERNL